MARSDRVTVAVTLYALLELYKQGEATWTQEEPFAEITVSPQTAVASPQPQGALPLGFGFASPRGLLDPQTGRERVA